MPWQQWIALLPLGITGGWMTFDGARALIVGDYVTPKSGSHAGQLGPWAALLRKAGVDPRSTAVKWTFIVEGIATIGSLVALLCGASWGTTACLACAIVGLWYLPVGTAFCAIATGLLLWARMAG